MKVLVRADASVEIGMGHRVRCQALVHALIALGWQCEFVVDHRYKSFALPTDCFINSELEFFTLAKNANLVILDHYGYDAKMIDQLYQHQSNLLVLDDMNDRGGFSSRWVLNPLAETYSTSIEFPLTGSRYALLRPTFSQSSERFQLPANKLLITLGGTDPLGLTLPIVKGLLSSGFPTDCMLVLLGANATNADYVSTFCHKKRIAVERGLLDVTPLMRQAKMAMSAAGGTLFELAYFGIPTLFAQVAGNQTRSLEQHVPLDWCRSIRFDDVVETVRQERVKLLVEQFHRLWIDDGWQQKAHQTAIDLVDGEGANRVAKVISDRIFLN